MASSADILMSHLDSPRNAGCLEDPDRVGQVGTPGRGPYLVLHLRLENGVVRDSRFQTYGCGAAIASGSMLTVLIKDRRVEECLRLTPADLNDALGGVPADKLHCPALAIAALRDALKDNPNGTRINADAANFRGSDPRASA